MPSAPCNVQTAPVGCICFNILAYLMTRIARNSKVDIDTYKARFAPDSSPGWDAIDAHLAAHLGRPEADLHFGAATPFALGGDNPLDGVSVYIRRNPDHLLFISYGLSTLYYDENAVGEEYSGWGFELTFRLALEASERPNESPDVPQWPMNLMQNLARYVFQSQKWFEHGHYITAGGPIKAGSTTDKTALLFCSDPELGWTDTPHGRVDFLQMVGITGAEFDGLKANTLSAEALINEKAAAHPLMITSLSER